ncbi:laccase-like protein [Lasiosphaeria hispida]|uniref:Laccase-like protein n=1 Tax=Lasiosphaeria hispida TaxID=260671 RepID=A0AAJ0HEX0_9PEZI|nr:laccase-like protein [Lasiosphaeria hispida]
MRARTLFSLLLGAWLPAAVLADTVVHDDSFAPDHVLRVTYAEATTECETRSSVIVNGTTPGPAIHLLPGAISWIRVYNDMTDQNLTMHWHGLVQRLAPFGDGTPLASQWPIPPGHFFDYEISTEVDDSGTYFYHSHVGMQAMTCSGPLIVDDCGASPYIYDDERIFHFQDYFFQTDCQLFGEVTSPPFTGFGRTDGILLNGKGVANGKTASTDAPGGDRGFFGGGHSSPPGRAPRRRLTRRDDDQTGMSSDYGLPVIDVEPGKTYRFRFIGGTGLSFLTMALEGHGNLTIVQVDGSEYNAPVSTDHLQMGPGQRFDVMFKSKTVDELVADGNKSTYFLQFETRERLNPYRGYGVLRYSPDAMIPMPPSQPIFDLPTDVANWLEYTFQPLNPGANEFPTAAEVTRRVVIDAELVNDATTGRVMWELAHLSWTEFTYQKPTLVDIYERGQDAIPNFEAAVKNYGWDPATKSFPARIGEVLEIVLQNTGATAGQPGSVETHPFHAHSKHYYDIGSGKGKYDADANNAKLEQLGYRPVKRDTTMLFRYADEVNAGEAAGWRAWRIRITSPGVWMIHCHILAHMMAGMQSVWVIGNADQIRDIPLSMSQNYLTYGGSVMGNATHSPSLFQYFNGTNKCRPAQAGQPNQLGNLSRRA